MSPTSIISILVLSTWVQFAPVCSVVQEFNLRVLYKEYPPYIYTDQNTGKLVGSFINYLDEINKGYCKEFVNNNISTLRIQYDQKGWNDFVTPANHTIIFPIVKVRKSDKLFMVFSAPSVAIIIQESQINFAYKFLVSFSELQLFMVLTLFIIISLAFLTWAFEWRVKKLSFIKGICTSMWFGSVTVSGVGYGDIVPRTLPSRIVTVILMIFGYILSSLTIASVTQGYLTTENFKFGHKKIAILSQSYDEKEMRRNDFHEFQKDELVGYDTYAEVLEAVRSGEAFAGVLNSEIAGYMQDTMNDDDTKQKLSIVKVLPITIPVYMSAVETAPAVEYCLHNNHNQAVDHSKFYTHRFLMMDKLHKDNFETLFTHNKYIFIPFIAICVAIAAGIIFDVFVFITRKMRERLQRDYSTSSKSRTNTSKSFENELVYMRHEIARIKVNLAELILMLEQQPVAINEKIGRNESLI